MGIKKAVKKAVKKITEKAETKAVVSGRDGASRKRSFGVIK